MNGSGNTGFNSILLLVDRLKRRTRDPDVLTLCDAAGFFILSQSEFAHLRDAS
jgi:hypothetical protein